MSQIARAKKMFDDVSSDDDSETNDAAALSSAGPVQHTDPEVSRASNIPRKKAESIIVSEHAVDDPTVFVTIPASASQARGGPEHEQSNGESGEDAAKAASQRSNESREAQGETMVMHVDVSPLPKETHVAKSSHGDAIKKAASSRSVKLTASTTPSKSAAARAATASSTYSTPATVSKRPAEQEEKVAEMDAQTDSNVRKSKKVASATKNVRYEERREKLVPEEVAFSTDAHHNESRTRRSQQQQREEADTQHSPYSTTSRRKHTAQQLEFSHEELHDEQTDCGAYLNKQYRHTSDESEVEDCPFSTYVFPRLDPALADYQGCRTNVGAARHWEECPPNACERSLAYLMATDIRMSVYLGILFFATVFQIVSIPTSQLDLVGKSCFTYWGFKDDCDSATYTFSRTIYPCSATRSRLGAGAAFSIITVVLYVVNFTATLITLFCVRDAPHKISLTSRVVVATLGFMIVVTQAISWAVIAGIHSSHYCVESGALAFGVGFGLNVTSWIINFLGVVLVVAVPSQLVNRHQRPY